MGAKPFPVAAFTHPATAVVADRAIAGRAWLVGSPAIAEHVAGAADRDASGKLSLDPGHGRSTGNQERNLVPPPVLRFDMVPFDGLSAAVYADGLHRQLFRKRSRLGLVLLAVRHLIASDSEAIRQAHEPSRLIASSY
ncbi:MAG: hypothetical protein DRH30_14290 [Deltaproteobacteria bacterium]|nr:MAG: hypothetical protein DRH30_14290 [Deltaproteobacteria bacterium]